MLQKKLILVKEPIQPAAAINLVAAVTRRNVAAVRNASVETTVNALLRRNVAKNASVVTRRNAAAAARNANVNISKNLT